MPRRNPAIHRFHRGNSSFKRNRCAHLSPGKSQYFCGVTHSEYAVISAAVPAQYCLKKCLAFISVMQIALCPLGMNHDTMDRLQTIVLIFAHKLPGLLYF